MNSKPYMNEKRAKNLLASRMKFQTKVDDRFFMIVEKHPLEKIDDIEGRCSNLIKLVCKIRIHVSGLAKSIITSKTFEGISLIVIVANSFSLAIEDPTSTYTPYY